MSRYVFAPESGPCSLRASGSPKHATVRNRPFPAHPPAWPTVGCAGYRSSEVTEVEHEVPSIHRLVLGWLPPVNSTEQIGRDAVASITAAAAVIQAHSIRAAYSKRLERPGKLGRRVGDGERQSPASRFADGERTHGVTRASDASSRAGQM